MRLRWGSAVVLGLAVAGVPAMLRGKSQTENAKGDKTPPGTFFRTSERCVACHNGLKTKVRARIFTDPDSSGRREHAMANSSRDLYWQGSVRRESNGIIRSRSR